MKATKHTVTITVEVLSIDTVPGLVQECVEQMRKEYVRGELKADDGDTVKWELTSNQVEF